MGIADLLAASRDGVRRLGPQETQDAVRRGALLVDTRTEAQRRRQGELQSYSFPAWPPDCR